MAVGFLSLPPAKIFISGFAIDKFGSELVLALSIFSSKSETTGSFSINRRGLFLYF